MHASATSVQLQNSHHVHSTTTIHSNSTLQHQQHSTSTTRWILRVADAFHRCCSSLSSSCSLLRDTTRRRRRTTVIVLFFGAVTVCIVLVLFFLLGTSILTDTVEVMGDPNLALHDKYTIMANNVRAALEARGMGHLFASSSSDDEMDRFNETIMREMERLRKERLNKHRLGHSIVEPLQSDFLRTSLDGDNFYSPKCRLSTENVYDGGCKANPWFHPPLHEDGKMREFTCPARKSERERLRFREEEEHAERNRGRTNNNNNNNNKNEHRSSPSHHVADDDVQSELQNFKRYTSWMFDKWYDWTKKNVQCVPPLTNNNSSDDNRRRQSKQSKKKRCGPNDGILRGHHDHNDLYLLENFCLSPMGRMSAYFEGERGSNPMMPGIDDVLPAPVPPADNSYAAGYHPFEGVAEAWAVHRSPDGGTADFLDLKSVNRLRRKPKCFLEIPRVIILGVGHHFGNQGHGFHKTASLLRYIEVAYGKLAREQLEDVLIIYVVTNRGYGYASTPEANENLNAHHNFYDIIGTSWLSVFGDHVPQIVDAWRGKMLFEDIPTTAENKKRFYPELFNESLLTNTTICFRHAYVWHNAHEKYAAVPTFRTSADEPGKQYAFSLFGPRSKHDGDTLNLMNRRLRQCPSAPPLAPRRELALRLMSADVDEVGGGQHQKQQLQRHRHDVLRPPHVLFNVRSSFRRFTLQPHVINVMAQYVTNELGGTFEVLEHIALTYEEIIARFSNADILIGMYGAGLIWLDFMPPHAVFIEFNTPHFRYAHVAGINKNPIADFGGSCIAAQLHHVALTHRSEGLLRFPPNIAEDEEWGGREAWRQSGGGQHVDYAAGAVLVKFALGRAKCIFDRLPVFSSSRKRERHLRRRYHVAVNDAADPTDVDMNPFFELRSPGEIPEECQFDLGVVEDVVRQDLMDAGGDSLAAFVQMQLPPFSSSSSSQRQKQLEPPPTATPTATGGKPQNKKMKKKNAKLTRSMIEAAFPKTNLPLSRMKLMIDFRAEVSAAIAPFREMPDRHTYLRMLILMPCEVQIDPPESDDERIFPISPEYRAKYAHTINADMTHRKWPEDKQREPAIISEIKSWRGILRDVYHVTIAEYYREDEDEESALDHLLGAAAAAAATTEEHKDDHRGGGGGGGGSSNMPSSSPFSGFSGACARPPPRTERDVAQRENEQRLRMNNSLFWHGVRVCVFPCDNQDHDTTNDDDEREASQQRQEAKTSAGAELKNRKRNINDDKFFDIIIRTIGGGHHQITKGSSHVSSRHYHHHRTGNKKKKSSSSTSSSASYDSYRDHNNAVHAALLEKFARRPSSSIIETVDNDIEYFSDMIGVGKRGASSSAGAQWRRAGGKVLTFDIENNLFTEEGHAESVVSRHLMKVFVVAVGCFVAVVFAAKVFHGVRSRYFS